MAKIVIEFDTVEKTAKATIDGEEMDNFAGANLYKRYDYGDQGEGEGDNFCCSLTFREHDSDEGITRLMQVIASQGVKVEPKKKPVDRAKLHAAVASYFEGRR